MEAVWSSVEEFNRGEPSVVEGLRHSIMEVGLKVRKEIMGRMKGIIINNIIYNNINNKINNT